MKALKKSVSIILSLLMVIGIFTIVPFAVSAETNGEFEYTVLEDGTAEITEYTGSVAEVNIPSELDGKKVTSISNNVFNSRTNLKNVNIPDGVTSIGDYVFYNCTSLTSISISGRVTRIGYEAFFGCSSLNNIDVDVNNKDYCSINGDLYNKEKTNLIQYAIGKTETNFTVPDYVTYINDSAFYRCTNLKNIDVDDNNKDYCSINGNLYNKEKTKLIQYAIGKSEASFTIPNSVTEIGYKAFSGCKSLTSINIPESVTSIGGEAFEYCTSLTNVNIPNSVTEIGDRAFSGCTNLMSLNIPDSVTRIEIQMFFECTSLTNITIGNGVTSIGECAFDGCRSLTSINIPESVTSIDDYAFSRCTNLKNIDVDNNNKYYCSISGNLYNKEKTTLIQYAVGKTETSFTIPNNITSIGINAFSGGTSLMSVNIPNSVTSIGGGAFKDCTSLTNVKIGNGLTTIGGVAFENCISLKSINIPDSVKSIGMDAIGYYSEYDEEGFLCSHHIDKFTIYGKKGTAAEKYANDNGFTFKENQTATKTSTNNNTSKVDQKSKKTNTITVKAKTKTIKLKKLKKKAQTVKPLTVKKAKGKVTYKLIKKGTTKKIWKYLKISKKGAITVKKWKKAKKGTYKIKVRVTVAGNKSYRKGAKTVTAKIRIK